MPRKLRNFQNNTYYHVFNRGVNKERIFSEAKDKKYFVRLLYQELQKTDLVLDSYVIMHNHYHLILKVTKNTTMISRYIQRVCTAYSKYLNYTYSRTGHVFEGRYHANALYLKEDIRRTRKYLKENPVEAGYVKECDMYKWSKIGKG